MSTHKHIDRICCAVLALVLILTIVFVNAGQLGIQSAKSELGYESKLFDTSSVHTIDLVMDDWDSFIDTCENEEYAVCTVVIDGETYKNIGIRAKGNTSLSSVAAYGNNRYSFKLEFDHYDDTESYYGLDKISLNNIIQDNTYMKDYLSYQLMGQFGVASPLCSYVYITVNGEDWGLYLAVESVEESFLERNYGSNYGELYKPDSMSMGGGRGNGENFNPSEDQSERLKPDDSTATSNANDSEKPDDAQNGTLPDQTNTEQQESAAADNNQTSKDKSRETWFNSKGTGSDDVSLIYSDDEYTSYANIFDNAKTDVTDADKDRLIASLKQMNECTDLQEVVDIEQVIRYFVVHNFVCNFDSYTGSMMHNYYLYEQNGVLSMIPWDYNLAFGGFQSSEDSTSLVNYPIDSPVSGGTLESRPMLAWIFSSETYTEQYHQYFAEFIETYFDNGDLSAMIDEVSEMIAPYVEKDPTKFCTTEEFETGVETLKQFCELRSESIRGQLNGSIPSTSDEQNTDASVLIDASSITVSAMGSQGRNDLGNGVQAVFGAQEEQSPADMGEDQTMPSADSYQQSEPMQMPDGTQRGNDENAPSQNMDEPPDGVSDRSDSEQRSSASAISPKENSIDNFGVETAQISNFSWLLLGISCILLFLCLLIAAKIKR